MTKDRDQLTPAIDDDAAKIEKRRQHGDVDDERDGISPQRVDEILEDEKDADSDD